MNDQCQSRLIRVRFMGKPGTEEVPLAEAVRILEDVYDGPCGGFVADSKTNRIIYRIEPETEEITVLEELLGGG